MLHELSVCGLGIIDEVSIVFTSGFNVLTGETGAGKTLILDAIKLLLGSQGGSTLIKADISQAVIEARFSDLEVSRIVPRDKKGKSWVNGEQVPVVALRGLLEDEVEIHGQNLHLKLLNESTQREVLDRYAGVDIKKQKELELKLKQAKNDLEELKESTEKLRLEKEWLFNEIDRIEKLNIKSAGELDELADEESLLDNAARVQDTIGKILDLIDDDGGISYSQKLSSHIILLERLGLKEVEPLALRLKSVSIELDDISSEIKKMVDLFALDPNRLAFVKDRKAKLSEIAKRHGGELGNVIEYLEIAKERLKVSQEAGKKEFELNKIIKELESSLQKENALLLKQRSEASKKLSVCVEENLAKLSLAGAKFTVEIGNSKGTSSKYATNGDGSDVSFLLCANPGEKLQPIKKAASGGELSRIMLALRLVLSPSLKSTKGDPVIIFDEVDAGVGGSAALKVGQALYELSRFRQVIVVTHLPQVAAFADNHINIEKISHENRTSVNTQILDNNSRLIELSRMLSGLRGSESGIKHAAELLESVEKLKTGR